MGKLKWVFTSIALTIVLISLTLSLFLFFIILNKDLIIDERNVNWFDMLIKSSFTLIGSTLSGFIAILVFYLNYLREKRNERKKSDKLMKIIAKEFNDNKKKLEKVSDTIKSESFEVIAEYLLAPKSEVLELFIIVSSQISTPLYEANIKDLRDEDYLEIVEQLNIIKSCISILNLIVSGINSKENLELLLEQLSIQLTKLRKYKEIEV